MRPQATRYRSHVAFELAWAALVGIALVLLLIVVGDCVAAWLAAGRQ
jgi:hypothetical protein